MKKLEIFGDSILRGVVFDEANNKYRLCDDHKYASLSAHGLAVQNNSKMGATVAKGSEIFEKRLADIDENSIVLLEFGGNDCDYDWQAISENPDGAFLPKTPEADFIGKYSRMIKAAKEKGAAVYLATLAPIDCEKYMRWITRGRSYENVLRWLGDIPHLSRWQAYYNQLVEKIAAACGCPLLDMRAALLESGDIGDITCADGIHPTPAAHKVIHQFLCDRLAV